MPEKTQFAQIAVAMAQMQANLRYGYYGPELTGGMRRKSWRTTA